MQKEMNNDAELAQYFCQVINSENVEERVVQKAVLNQFEDYLLKTDTLAYKIVNSLNEVNQHIMRQQQVQADIKLQEEKERANT